MTTCDEDGSRLAYGRDDDRLLRRLCRVRGRGVWVGKRPAVGTQEHEVQYYSFALFFSCAIASLSPHLSSRRLYAKLLPIEKNNVPLVPHPVQCSNYCIHRFYRRIAPSPSKSREALNPVVCLRHSSVALTISVRPYALHLGKCPGLPSDVHQCIVAC